MSDNMDSDKEVNNSGKNLTPFSIADILSGSSKSAAVHPPTPQPHPAHPYPWFLFNHPPWAFMMPDPSVSTRVDHGISDGQTGNSGKTNNGLPPEEEDDGLSEAELFSHDDDDDDDNDEEEDDGSNSIIGSMTSTDDGQQEDPLDMRANHHNQHRRNRKTAFNNFLLRI